MERESEHVLINDAGINSKALGITSVVVNPAWVATDMGNANARLTPAESASGSSPLEERLRARSGR